jgi:hypothetical protein
MLGFSERRQLPWHRGEDRSCHPCCRDEFAADPAAHLTTDAAVPQPPSEGETDGTLTVITPVTRRAYGREPR